MKIAVTYENGQIFQHFGHTERFKIYTVETVADRTVTKRNGGKEILSLPPFTI